MIVTDYEELNENQRKLKHKDVKEIAKDIRKELKQTLDIKTSVRIKRGGYTSSITITAFCERSNEIYNQIKEVVDKYQVGISDWYTDYFDYNFYSSIYFEY